MRATCSLPPTRSPVRPRTQPEPPTPPSLPFLSAPSRSYVLLSAPGLEPYHADIAALRLVIEHLTALEGDFWVKLRGAGLTYGADLVNRDERRTLEFDLSRCADALAAYRASKAIVAE